jgi:phage tail-like protein
MDTRDSDKESSGGSSRRDVLKFAGLAGLAGMAATAAPSPAAGAGFLRTAVSGTHFKLEIDGVIVGGVHTIDAVDSESDVVFTPNSGAPGVTASPGAVTVQSVSIERGYSANQEWYKWRKAVLDGKVDRRSMSIIILSDTGQEIARYNFFECWPTKYHGPALSKAKSSAHATEKIEVVWETFEMK